ncbi:MAG: hypothetical protein FWF35_02235 [Elusimicrobia bacterium]|nr:hypothetical protein [Elusimicrobiota bacterium]
MSNKKGSALMQVLLITIVVATIATAILRIAISRTTTAANTVRTISAKNILEGCNAQIQSQLVRGQLSTNSDGSFTSQCVIQAGPTSTDTITVTVKGTPVNDPTTNMTYTRLDFNIPAAADLQKL